MKNNIQPIPLFLTMPIVGRRSTPTGILNAAEELSLLFYQNKNIHSPEMPVAYASKTSLFNMFSPVVLFAVNSFGSLFEDNNKKLYHTKMLLETAKLSLHPDIQVGLSISQWIESGNQEFFTGQLQNFISIFFSVFGRYPAYLTLDTHIALDVTYVSLLKKCSPGTRIAQGYAMPTDEAKLLDFQCTIDSLGEVSRLVQLVVSPDFKDYALLQKTHDFLDYSGKSTMYCLPTFQKHNDLLGLVSVIQALHSGALELGFFPDSLTIGELRDTLHWLYKETLFRSLPTPREVTLN